MLADSGLLHLLQRRAVYPFGQPMCINGDPAYPLRLQKCGSYTFNALMSAVQVSIEWLFGDIVNFFKFIDLKKKLKIGLSNVGKIYIVCALLQNALTCLYGNLTSEYFDCHPPSLEDYFA